MAKITTKRTNRGVISKRAIDEVYDVEYIVMSDLKWKHWVKFEDTEIQKDAEQNSTVSVYAYYSMGEQAQTLSIRITAKSVDKSTKLPVELSATYVCQISFAGRKVNQEERANAMAHVAGTVVWQNFRMLFTTMMNQGDVSVPPLPTVWHNVNLRPFKSEVASEKSP